MQRTISAWRLRRRLPGRAQASAAIRAGMSPGGRNAGSSGSTTVASAGTPGGRGEQVGQVDGRARRSFQVRSDSGSSHRPMTLRR